MSDKEDYLTSYRVFFETFAATLNPEDQLPVQVAGYSITEEELPGEVLYWTTQYLVEKQCPQPLMTPLRRIILEEVVTAAKNQPEEFGFDIQNSVYIALRLMQAVTSHVNSVCLRYTDNARLDTLPAPSSVCEMRTVSAATKNRRRVMEDRHVEIGDLEALFGIQCPEPTSFYAVYDGHAGSAAAIYCAAHLHQYLVESPHFTKDLPRALRDAFQRTDVEFVRKQNEKRACGGSTAVVVVIRGRTLHAAWAGDSQALLAKRMRLMQLVHPHKPNRQDERSRIEASGGTVMHWGIWRVNGQLAVSRAIGDAQYKPYVTARPEIATVELDGDEDFVVVACDGLWDFVSEDQVALSVYCQLASDPGVRSLRARHLKMKSSAETQHLRVRRRWSTLIAKESKIPIYDLKAVTKKLLLQAKRQNSTDNISVIVVFLKEPRAIAADNDPPMELGLENPLATAPPFAVDTESCKRPAEGGGCGGGGGDADGAEPADNGVDHSDSDSEEDLGPETAVDADDVDADADAERAPRTPPTPLAHTVEAARHKDGALVDNVGESGEESEDEWNYFKGEGDADRDDRELPSDQPDADDSPRSPCHDNSAWESSSVDMNSSPLNPDAPVFVPGGVGGAGGGALAADVLLAESPRKPLPMDDVELPSDAAHFRTEAGGRPADLLDLDNLDHLNGHDNTSIEETKEQLNGNEKSDIDSLGFGFDVDKESDKIKDQNYVQDLERIQKDTMDFGNIQVFQTETDISPISTEIDEELFERLKNKERDPMSMSFYQEKDDDTCERFMGQPQVDLNAVQPLPDSDDEDLMEENGISESTKFDKENVDPEQSAQQIKTENSLQEPNNDVHVEADLLGTGNINLAQGDNFRDYNVSNSNNLQAYSNIDFESGDAPPQGTVILPTDTPESHKLLFEQIPEIPDGKNSELGFTNDILDQSEGDKDHETLTPQEETKQDSIESKTTGVVPSDVGESPEGAKSPELNHEFQPNIFSMDKSSNDGVTLFDKNRNESTNEFEHQRQTNPFSFEADAIVDFDDVSEVNLHETKSDILKFELQDSTINEKPEFSHEVQVHAHKNIVQSTDVEELTSVSPLSSVHPHQEIESRSPLPVELLHSEVILSTSPAPTTSPLPSKSLLPGESSLLVDSELPEETVFSAESPIPYDSQNTASPLPAKENIYAEESPFTSESPLPTGSPLPKESQLLSESPLSKTPLLTEAPMQAASLVPSESPILTESSLPTDTCLIEKAIEPPQLTENVCESPQPPQSDSFDKLKQTESHTLDSKHITCIRNAGITGILQNRETGETTKYESLHEHTPDLVPESTELYHVNNTSEMPSQPVTDIDIGIQESRAQEICMPVTNVIHQEDMLERNVEAATPPPTPAVELSASPLDNLVQPEPITVNETPFAADSEALAADKSNVEALGIAAGAAAAAVAVSAATAAAVTSANKGKPTSAKKPASALKTTPAATKLAPKSGQTPRVATAPAKKTPSTTPLLKTPTSATPKTGLGKTTPSKTSSTNTTLTLKPSSQKISPTAKSTASRVASATAKEPAATTKEPLATAKEPTATTKEPSATAKEPTAISRTTTTTKTAPITKSFTKPTTHVPKSAPTAGRPATGTARPAAARTVGSTTRPPISASTKPKSQVAATKTDKKDLVNGDMKTTVKKTLSSTRTVASTTTRPAPRSAPAAAGGAPQPAPRPTKATAAVTLAPKASGPKPAARATPFSTTLGKPNKNTNKNCDNKATTQLGTAPTIPPPIRRTAPVKGPVKRTTVKEASKKGGVDSGPLTNGSREPAPAKAPPSPPAVDNALLPDVIA